jgi:hypothetical protein
VLRQFGKSNFEHPAEILTERICFLDLPVSPKKRIMSLCTSSIRGWRKTGVGTTWIDLRELNWPVVLHLSGRDFVGR